MSESTELRAAEFGAPSAVDRAASRSDPTDRPVPVWPEGVLAIAACATLLVIALRHRTWIQRKVTEAQRVVEEFQRQGGVEDLTQVARQAAEMLRGSG